MIGFVSSGFQLKLSRHLRAANLAVCCCCAGVAWSAWITARAQVLTVDTKYGGIQSRYADIKRTHVDLSSQPVLQRTKLQLVRVLEAEQGFAMRPIPKGSKGMVLIANGEANPNGPEYAKSLEHNGIAFQAADRVMITDIKFYPDKIVFEFNGGPDKSHKILRHISVGANGVMVPLVPDNGQEPIGARLTLQFEKFVPEMTGTEVKELLSPLVDFKLKTPVQAFTDTLPPQLKEAILSHHVLVGMSPEMVTYAMGHPDSKSREREGNMPFEEWIYGQPPKDVEFVRFNGNRVIQVEDCKLGEPPIIRNKDEMGDYWNNAPTPPANIHEIKLGDVNSASVNQQSGNTAPPSLRKQGETLPADSNPNIPQMGKVQFPPGMDGDKPAPPANPPANTPPASTSGGNNGGTQQSSPPPSQQYSSI
jgi:hypothetical protein